MKRGGRAARPLATALPWQVWVMTGWRPGVPAPAAGGRQQRAPRSPRLLAVLQRCHLRSHQWWGCAACRTTRRPERPAPLGMALRCGTHRVDDDRERAAQIVSVRLLLRTSTAPVGRETSSTSAAAASCRPPCCHAMRCATNAALATRGARSTPGSSCCPPSSERKTTVTAILERVGKPTHADARRRMGTRCALGVCAAAPLRLAQQ